MLQKAINRVLANMKNELNKAMDSQELSNNEKNEMKKDLAAVEKFLEDVDLEELNLQLGVD